MKINEVEALVGITKKNIRFYEEQDGTARTAIGSTVSRRWSSCGRSSC